MTMQDYTLSITCDTAGAVTVNGPRAILGKLYAVQVTQGSLASGVDLTISTQNGAASKTLLTITDSTASALYYPRDLVHDAAGSALTGTAGGDRTCPLLDGTPRVVVAQGGDSKIGAVTLYYTDD
jgi:hypothetical protein